jgi:sulfate adenylyltransferase subunit 2
MLWSMGKDSTALLWMTRKLFGRIPFPIYHIDTSFKIPEMIEFREELAAKWDVPLRVFRNAKEIENGMSPQAGRQNCCKQLKTIPLLDLISSEKLEALLIGIRRDEEGSRSKERYFSLRAASGQWDFQNQDTEVFGLWPTAVAAAHHYRAHPLLAWTEKDIWQYTAHEEIPFSSLYLSRNGKRYRSLGCAPCTGQVFSTADTLPKILEELQTTQTAEREGRAQDSETRYGLEKLRQQGYM